LTVRSEHCSACEVSRAVRPRNASSRHSSSRGLSIERALAIERLTSGQMLRADQASMAASARSVSSRGLNMKHSKARPAGSENSTRTTVW
jgi:DNA-binding transcriptional regulator YdaS (Cro superfamily)